MDTVTVDGIEYVKDGVGRLVPVKQSKEVTISFAGNETTISLTKFLFLVSLLDLISDETDLLFGEGDKMFLSSSGEQYVCDLYLGLQPLAPLDEWIDGTSIQEVSEDMWTNCWTPLEGVRRNY